MKEIEAKEMASIQKACLIIRCNSRSILIAAFRGVKVRTHVRGLEVSSERRKASLINNGRIRLMVACLL